MMNMIKKIKAMFKHNEPEYAPKNFGDELTRRRVLLKMSPMELCNKAGIDLKDLFFWECNLRLEKLSPWHVYSLSQSLNWSVDSMLRLIKEVQSK